MKTILLPILASALLFCDLYAQDIPLKSRTYNDAELNTTLTSEIGESIITSGKEYFQDGIKVMQSVKRNIRLFPVDIYEGQIIPLIARKGDFELYGVNGSSGGHGYSSGIAINLKTGQKNAFTKSVNGFSTRLIEGLKTEPAMYSVRCDDCFKREFVYNGKSGNTLKFIYREYINDMARPAFNQDLQYDLSGGNIVGIKGLRVEILNTTNTNVDYKVLSYFNN